MHAMYITYGISIMETCVRLVGYLLLACYVPRRNLVLPWSEDADADADEDEDEDEDEKANQLTSNWPLLHSPQSEPQQYPN